MPELSILSQSLDGRVFENMCRDVLIVQYGQDFQLYGRSGQQQSGVDIISKNPDEDGKFIAVQCKLYRSSLTNGFSREIQLKMMLDYNIISGLPFAVSEYIYMINVPRNSMLIEFVSLMNKDTEAIRMKVIFWDDIYETVFKTENLQKKYGQFFKDAIPKIKTQDKKYSNILTKIYIRELSLVNYRKFKQQEFTLNPQMNVFAGKNGTGKTSVIEAICVLLGAYLAAFSHYVPSRYVFNIRSGDAHLEPISMLNPNITTPGGIPTYPCTVSGTLNCEIDEKEKTFSYKRTLVKEQGRTKFDGENPMKKIVATWEKLFTEANHLDKDVILPVMLYLSSARLWNGTISNNSSSLYTRTEGYTRCLDNKHGIDLAFGYIQRLQSIAVEEQNGTTLPVYTAIVNAVNEVLRDELKDGEKAIFSSRYGKDLVAIQQKNNTVIPFTALSDGYRNVIMMVLDIAARMCILNPYLGEDALQKTPGIVLIDELDLSLHPTWQKRIVRLLKEIFPKVQFICATHSPFIIQSLEDGELISLDNKIETDYAGESIEDIAEDIMGVEMPQYSEKKRQMYEVAERYYDAVENCKTEEEIKNLREELVKIEAEYSDNPAYLALIRQKYQEKEMDI